MAAPIVIIHGPQASGKTHHAERFLRHYGCKRIVDTWCGPQDRKLMPGDLALTTEQPDRWAVGGAVWISIATALRAIGGKKPRSQP